MNDVALERKLRARSARIAVVGLTQIVFALLLDVIFLGDLPGLQKLLGIALVIAPTAWLMLRQRGTAIPEPL